MIVSLAASEPSSLSFYTNASTLFAGIGVGTVIQSLVPTNLITLRGRIRWACMDVGLTFAALCALGAGEILVQTVISRGHQKAGEHAWTVFFMSSAVGAVLLKLALQRMLTVGWKVEQQRLRPDWPTLKSIGLSVASGVGVGVAAIGGVILRSGTSFWLAIIGGCVLALGAGGWLGVRLKQLT